MCCDIYNNTLCCSVHSQRIVIREGHIGQNFYFVYSGSVFVNVTESSPDGKPFVKTEAVLSKGDSFGVSHSL